MKSEEDFEAFQKLKKTEELLESMHPPIIAEDLRQAFELVKPE